MRIDAHVHYTPPSMQENFAEFAEREPYWGLLISPDSDNHTIQGWATPERMIDDMDAAGIDRVVVMAEYRLRHESCIERNEQALRIIRRYPERVTAFACIQPKAGQAALEELQRCLDGGMLGVGELNPYGQGHTLADPDFLAMVEMCIERDVPLNLHVSEEVGHYYPGKSTTPLRHYYELAQRYPELKLILAHWGGGLFLYEIMPEVRKNLHNVWYDTAASPLLYPTRKIFDIALRCVDHRKILFGSDYPLLIYPRRQAEPDMRPFLEEIDTLELPSPVLEDVLGNNAARLLGWLEDDRPAAKPKKQPSIPALDIPIAGLMPVTAVARQWPETQAVFEKHGIPCEDSPVATWEPIMQAAAARGMSPAEQNNLIVELNEALGSGPASEVQSDGLD